MRKACKLDPEVKTINKDAAILFTKAVELFVGFLARKSAYTVSLRGARSIREQDLIQTIYMNEQLEFLRIDFPRKTLVNTAGSSGSGSRNGYSHSSNRASAASAGTTPKHRIVAAPRASATGNGRRSGKGDLDHVGTSGKSIASFFGGGERSGKKRSVDESANPDDEVEGEEDVVDVEEVVEATTYSVGDSDNDNAVESDAEEDV